MVSHRNRSASSGAKTSTSTSCPICDPRLVLVITTWQRPTDGRCGRIPSSDTTLSNTSSACSGRVCRWLRTRAAVTSALSSGRYNPSRSASSTNPALIWSGVSAPIQATSHPSDTRCRA
ncbi:hypothetical protein [Lentzea kristufekii]|uniref:hypothetical protein n=1 Tax=Lentzea kristufekii TaxID=3095430 RepID=UPI0038734AEF